MSKLDVYEWFKAREGKLIETTQVSRGQVWAPEDRRVEVKGSRIFLNGSRVDLSGSQHLARLDMTGAVVEWVDEDGQLISLTSYRDARDNA